jgi:hypothetical protein
VEWTTNAIINIKYNEKYFRITIISLFTIGLLYLVLLLCPVILFPNKVEYKNIAVYSDTKIDHNFKFILKDALNRISKSELYDSTMHFNIFICNGLWRFMIFTQGNKDAGAVTYQRLTGNIFFRPSDIAKNKIIPPASWKFAKNLSSFSDRPFSYVISLRMRLHTNLKQILQDD